MPASEDTHLKLLRLLEDNPSVTQREMADELNVSLGKANYCLRALVEKGWVKANNFRNAENKGAYLYLLTPSGIKAKGALTLHYLQRKMEEYEALRAEIDELKDSLGQ